MKSPSPRLAAVHAIGLILDRQQNLDQALQQTLADIGDPRDKGLAQHLVYGCMRWWPVLNHFAAQLIKQPLKAKDSDLQHLICIGLLQLWRDDTPAHAAIYETVNVARELKKPWASRLVNGVLRSFQRRLPALQKKLAAEPERLLAHPDWLLQAFKQDWPKDWADLAAANNRHPPLWLRVNRLRTSRADYCAELDTAGIAYQTSPLFPDAVRLTDPLPVHRIPGFEHGRVSVQDTAAQAAADLLDLAPGQRVLDACAAPGGKTAHILERCSDLKHLSALDISAERLQRIQENLSRLGLDCEAKTADAGQPDHWWDGHAFDRILLDAPCSASGVIRRHPDIKWRRQPAQVGQVRQRQQRLLEALWPLLKRGGRLVYATCSVLSCENEQNICRFIQRTADAGAVEIAAEWGIARDAGRQLLPQRDATDGFYYAVLEKA